MFEFVANDMGPFGRRKRTLGILRSHPCLPLPSDCACQWTGLRCEQISTWTKKGQRGGGAVLQGTLNQICM